MRMTTLLLVLGAIVRLTTAAPEAYCHDRQAEGYTLAEVHVAAEERLAQELSAVSQAGGPRRDDVISISARLQRVFERITTAASRGSGAARTIDWALYVLEEPLPRASSTGSGKVVISTGFLDRYAPDDEQLALILGHEVAHALCEHEASRLSMIRARNAPHPLEARYAIEYLETEPAVRAQIAPLVRIQERIADRLGLELAVAAGFEAEKARAFFASVQRVDRERGLETAAHDPPAIREEVLRKIADRSRPERIATREWDCSP